MRRRGGGALPGHLRLGHLDDLEIHVVAERASRPFSARSMTFERIGMVLRRSTTL